MIERYTQVKRKTLDEDRIAICPHFGCKHLKKVKPLKFGIIGFRKYPNCSKHKLSLVFIDEFVENFIIAVNLCLFDESSLPPQSLSKLITKKAPESLQTFVNGWIYCNPVGRGAQIVSKYMNGLSKSYMKLLSRKQKKALNDIDKSKKYRELQQGLEKIAKEYSDFLQNLREKSNSFYKSEFLNPFSNEVRNLINNWLKSHLNEIRDLKHNKHSFTKNESLSQIKQYYDKILYAGTCALLLGESPALITKGINSFELFSAYHEFSQAGLCKKLSINEVDKYLEQLSHIKIKPAVYNLVKDQISEEVINFLSLNRNELIENGNIQNNEEEFILNYIKEIYLFLKNKTDSLNHLSITELHALPLKIYNILNETILKSNNFQEKDEFIEKLKKLYGFIYLGINLASKNKKVYVGQTTLTIEQEWGEIVQKANTLRKKRQNHPNQYIPARYILNAIAKYGSDVWDLKLIDIAFDKSELDCKERYYIVDVYDSINPKKGYNLTTGGRTGGRLSSETKKRVSKSVKDVWKMPGYKERLSKSQLASWNNERREEYSKFQLKLWENEERRQKASNHLKDRWANDEKRKKLMTRLSQNAKKRWEDPTKKMLDSLKNMQLSTKKEINNIQGFLIDIRDTKNQREFFNGVLFEKYGIKSHMTLNRRIKEILGGFGVNNHGEAHRFFYDRSIKEVMDFLDNPDGYTIFKDPLTKQFFTDVQNTKKSSDLYIKYRVWHKNGLIIKIKRIVGKFGINNYTTLKKILIEKGIDECLEYFAKLEQN
ncbi:MAG: hypothetical protein ACTSR7_17700 [Promethearchaeota archaeon]